MLVTYMELCSDLFGNPHKLSRCKMFGIYVHALTAHSPTQYELASLRSLNTENQERLFGQAWSIAETCTNHHLENVIAQVMVRLQAKQEQHMAMLSVERGDSQVSSVAKHLPKLPGTTVKSSFIRTAASKGSAHFSLLEKECGGIILQQGFISMMAMMILPHKAALSRCYIFARTL